MRIVVVTMLAATLTCIAGVAEAGTTAPATTPASTTTPATDPLAQQLAQQLAEQQALAATVQSLTSDLAAARTTQANLAQLVAADQQTIAATVTKLQADEQAYSNATQAEAAASSTAATDRAAEARDKQLLALYVRLTYQDDNSLIDYMLSSTSLSDLLSRAADLSQLRQSTTTLVNSIAAETAGAEAAEAAAAADAAAAAAATAQLQQQQLALQQQTTNAQSLISQLGTQAAATAQEIAAANSQTLAVAEQIAQTRLTQLDNTIAAAEQAAWQAAEYWLQNHLGTLPPSIAIPPTTPITGSSQLAWPVHGCIITQPFGPTTYPFEPSFDGYPHFHTGVDLAGPLGTPVSAAASGVVIAAMSTTQGYGNYIILASAGGILTLYGHLETMLVTAGETVTAGQPIGLLGSTGNSTGPHLHFEVRVNGQPVNPIPFLPALPQGASGP